MRECIMTVIILHAHGCWLSPSLKHGLFQTEDQNPSPERRTGGTTCPPADLPPASVHLNLPIHLAIVLALLGGMLAILSG